MKIKPIIATLATVTLLFGCTRSYNKSIPSPYFQDFSESRASTWNKLVGSWTGTKKLSDGGTYQWLMTLSGNGEYQLKAQITYQGKVDSHVEYGDWGASEDIFFTNFKGWIFDGRKVPSKRNDSYNRDVYEIKKLNDKTFIFYHIDSKVTFKSTRVVGAW